MEENITKNKTRNELMDDFIADMMLAPQAGLQLADPYLVSYYRDYNARCIWIDKEINDSLFNEIRLIMQWNREDDEKKIKPEKRIPIKLIIHSYGGTLDSCFALLDVMKISKTPIWTININQALSAGCLIFINGHKRFCLPLSQALIHNGSGGAGGNFNEVVAQTETYKKVVALMHNNILEHTKIDTKTLKKWDNKEIYLFAEDQIKYGLADEILEDISIIL